MRKKSVFIGSIGSIITFLSLSLSMAFAASTIGTSMSTTGTFTLTSGTNSATAARFQNASSYSVLTVNTTSLVASASAFGVKPGGTVDTSFEVGGTASISGIITLGGSGTAGGQFRPGTDGTTAFRFQNASGVTVLTVDTTNKIASASGFGVIPGGTLDTTFEVGGTASISGIITLGGRGTAGGQFRPGTDGTTAFRFQNAAGVSVLTIDTTNKTASVSSKFGINAGVATDTTFEAGGTASATALIVGGIGSASATPYTAQFTSTASTTVLFGGSATNKGTCLQLQDTLGANVYCRILGGGTVFTCSVKNCYNATH